MYCAYSMPLTLMGWVSMLLIVSCPPVYEAQGVTVTLCYKVTAICMQSSPQPPSAYLAWLLIPGPHLCHSDLFMARTCSNELQFIVIQMNRAVNSFSTLAFIARRCGLLKTCVVFRNVDFIYVLPLIHPWLGYKNKTIVLTS